MKALLTLLLLLGCFVALFRLMIFGRLHPLAPLGLIRGRTGPFRYSPRSPAVLLGELALAMALGTQLLFDGASLDLASAPHDPASTAHTAFLLAVLGAVLALLATTPFVMRNHVLDATAAIMAGLILLRSPSLDTFGQFALTLLLMRLGGMLGVAVSALAVFVGYYLLFATAGAGMVVLSLVMTTLMATLALMFMAFRRVF
jgi:hypothetical protein